MGRVARVLGVLGAAAALALVTSPGLGRGQDGAGQDEVARLTAAVAASPDEPRLRCELAFALVRAGRAEEARQAATVAIDALRPRDDRASTRLLGACLYNRGRAHGALGQPLRAVADYADSLDLRPNATVAARLAALEPDAPPGTPLALLAATIEAFAFDREVPVTTARSRGGLELALVPTARVDTPVIVAVARALAQNTTTRRSRPAGYE